MIDHLKILSYHGIPEIDSIGVSSGHAGWLWQFHDAPFEMPQLIASVRGETEEGTAIRLYYEARHILWEAVLNYERWYEQQ